MKKILLVSFISTGLTSIVWAEDIPGVSDLEQPRPPSTVTATNVASKINTTIEQQGKPIAQDEEVIIKEPVSATAVKTPDNVLPSAEVVDPNLDLEDTMKLMGQAFKALNQADNTNDMIEPIDRLITLSSQAQALGANMHEAERANFEMAIEQLRIKLAELHESVVDNDLKGAQAMLKKINEHRKKAYEYFNVD